jgi:adenylate cyclase
MDQYSEEPTLAGMLSDPLTMEVMKADGVDPRDLAATLAEIAAKLEIPPGLLGCQRQLGTIADPRSVRADPGPDASVALPKENPTGRSPRLLRSNLRLASGIVLLAFVACHLTAHGFLLVSFEWAQTALDRLMFPWRTVVGTTVLLAALLTHYLNALWSIYVRRYLRLSIWEWWQLSLGFCIPLLLMLHVINTRIAESLLTGTSAHYSSVLVVQWVLSPWLAVLQAGAVLTAWTHAAIGVHFWLRVRTWYAAWRPIFVGVALLLPAVALCGYVTAGNQVLRAAKYPDYVKSSLDESNLTDRKLVEIAQIARAAAAIYLALMVLPFVGRAVRGRLRYRGKPPLLTHSSGRVMPVASGATVLETLRENGVSHASLCGGRARCTTCRVLVTRGLDMLSAPSRLEVRALARIGARPGMRLACQVCPTADLSIMPLLAADASASDGTIHAGLEGNERLVTVLFVELQDSAALGESKLPFDLLYILNQFFSEMNRALHSTNGRYAHFTGDGFVALYGLDANDPADGVREALHGSREMLARIDQLNSRLKGDLPRPLRIGIGIHYGEAIVGSIGPPASQTLSAIGETMNICARLKGLTREFDCAVTISRRAAEMAGLGFKERQLHRATPRGLSQTVEFYALRTLADLRG